MNKQLRSSAYVVGLILSLMSSPQTMAAGLDVFDFTAYGQSSAIMFATPNGAQVIAIDIGPFVNSANVGRLGFFDTQSNTLTGEYIPAIGFPSALAFFSDNTRAYLSMSRAGGNIVTTGANRVELLDLTTRTLVDSIPIAGSSFGPSAIALSPDESKLYSLHRGDGRVDVIDTVTNTIVNQISVGTGAVDIDYSADNLRAYVSGRGNPVQVVVLDVATDSVETTLTPGLIATQSSVTAVVGPDRALYVASNADTNLKVIDIDPSSATFHDVVATIATTAQNIRQVVVSPALNELYLAAADSGNIVTVDIDPLSATYRQEIDALTLPENPNWITFQSAAIADLYVSINGDATGYFTVGGPLSDFDLDTIVNGSDNCSGDANVMQIDTNGDGFGNVCDADLNDDCMVNSQDLGLLRTAFFGAPGTGNWNPDADFNSDNAVNAIDLGSMKQRFFLFPGPSGVTQACD